VKATRANATAMAKVTTRAKSNSHRPIPSRIRCLTHSRRAVEQKPPTCCCQIQPPRLCSGNMTRYKIAVHADSKGGFWAEVPALPGCFSQGETLAELQENIREAISLYLETLKEEGRQAEPDVQILEVAV
jgi:antitoxin HicB